MFVKGQSGNEAGRPKGTTTASKIRKDIEEALPDILATVIKAAKGGDITAAKILIDRLCPTLKPVALPINLPVSGGLVEQGNEVIRAILDGEIPPDVGAALITALANQGKLIDLEEVSTRLANIERQLEARK
jgi:Family of unknown function (DUF5681)